MSDEDPNRYGFWKDRWDRGQTGFHEGAPNDFLVAHLDKLTSGPSRILVPLAGKTEDLFYLADRGHEVVGVEFVESAIVDLFARKNLDASKLRTSVGGHDAFVSGKLTMIRGDMLRMLAKDIGSFDAIFDRAALIAFLPELRAPYLAVCDALKRPDAPTLLVTFSYDQTKAEGPPWSVDEPTVARLFAGQRIEALGSRPSSIQPRFAEAGITSVAEAAYLVRAPLPQ